VDVGWRDLGVCGAALGCWRLWLVRALRLFWAARV
jgi:hypothetical protein